MAEPNDITSGKFWSGTGGSIIIIAGLIILWLIFDLASESLTRQSIMRSIDRKYGKTAKSRRSSSSKKS